MAACIGIGLALAAGASAYSASQTPDAPSPRNIGQETRDTLQARIDLEPQLGLLQEHDSARQMKLLQQSLLGVPGGPRQEVYDDVETVPEHAIGGDRHNPPDDPRAVWHQYSAGYGGSNSGGTWVVPATTRKVSKTRTVNDPSQRGYLDLLEHDITPALSRAQAEASSAQRTGDVADVSRLAAPARAALRSAQPEAASLLDLLTSQSADEVKAGTGMDAGMQREVEQSVRSAQGARGFGYGNNDVTQEVVTRGSAGQALLRARQAQAARVVGLNQGFYGDPFQAIIGRSSGVNAGAATATAGSTIAPQYNPENGYASDLYNTNYNAAAAANIGGYNSMNNLLGAGIGAAGQIYGGYLAGRGVGTSNPRAGAGVDGMGIYNAH